MLLPRELCHVAAQFVTDTLVGFPLNFGGNISSRWNLCGTNEAGVRLNPPKELSKCTLKDLNR